MQIQILVRLPNWLGDMVMSSAFINALHQTYPGAFVDVIAKKGLQDLVPGFQNVQHVYVFDKKEWPGIMGAYRFGKQIRQQKKYDLFFCLPDSFSSALMAFETGAQQRIGYKKEIRSFLLTASYTKAKSLHRVDEYLQLLKKFSHQEPITAKVELTTPVLQKNKSIIINFNSEAVSRRMPVAKAVSILKAVQKEFSHYKLVFIGSEKEKPHVEAIINGSGISGYQDVSGNTSLKELIHVLAGSSCMLSTDSGPAHLANALGVPTIVLFGAGNENNTAPYNKQHVTVVRNGKLPCEPCVKNTCQFGEPKCLIDMDIPKIINAINAQLK